MQTMAHLLSETDVKVAKVTDKMSETVHLMLNDPSMGLYRIQEHVKRSVPTLVEKKVELQSLQSNIQGATYDLDYSFKTVKSINWNPHFTIIQVQIKIEYTSNNKYHDFTSNWSQLPLAGSLINEGLFTFKECLKSAIASKACLQRLESAKTMDNQETSLEKEYEPDTLQEQDPIEVGEEPYQEIPIRHSSTQQRR
ncbi:BLOC-1-related complex subunit 8 homolog isoform X2 [Dendronephthya gigantea]|uniref:BLOC-1-related complex subunit 8 homolog isoform X2 n=1 Tax=Dendronephthya gigantea TaxID=151771 RepID=UPI00106A60F3|nr:BLOC-1-related complex subunit 8 homolog isoform X2 [Dendronephthya gigantea]